MAAELNGSGENRGVAFATTMWSVVVQAGEGDGRSLEARQAMEVLCRSYWYPLYAYVRRQGRGEEEAKDLTQEFFSRLLERNYLRALDRSRGRFRSWLLGAMEHFLAKEWRDARRLKRGGDQPLLSLDAEGTAEERYRLEPTDLASADRLYDRRWALELLELTMTRLRIEWETAGKGEQFRRLQGTLSGEALDQGYSDIAKDLGTTEGALKVVVHRLRRRYGELLREQIAATVQSEPEVEEELRHLMAALRS